MERIGSPTHQTLLASAAKDRRLSLGVRILSYFGWFATVYCAVNKRGWKVISGSATLSLVGTTAALYLHKRALHTDKKETAKQRFLELPYRDMNRPDWGSTLGILEVTTKEINARVNRDVTTMEPLDWWNKHREALSRGVLSEENRNLLADRFLGILDRLPTSEWGPYEQLEGLLDVARLRRWDEGIDSSPNFIELAPNLECLSPSLLEQRKILPRSYRRAREICLDAPYKSLKLRLKLLERWFDINKDHLQQRLNSECARATSFTDFVSRWSHKDSQDYFSDLFDDLTLDNRRHLKALYLQNPPAWLPTTLQLTPEEVAEAMKAIGYPNMHRLGMACKALNIFYNTTVYMLLSQEIRALSYREFTAKHGLRWRGAPIDPNHTLDLPLKEKLEAELQGASLLQLANLVGDCLLFEIDISNLGIAAAQRALEQMNSIESLLQLPPLVYQRKWVSGEMERVRPLVIAYLKGLNPEECQTLLASSSATYNNLREKGLIPRQIRTEIAKHQQAYREYQGQISTVLQQRTFAQGRRDAPDRLWRLAQTAENRPLVQQGLDEIIRQLGLALSQLA